MPNINPKQMEKMMKKMGIKQDHIEADEVIISEIYDVAGRDKDEDQAISSKDLVEAIQKDNISYASNLEQAEQMLKEKIKSEDVVIIMGAGDVDNVARNLVK